jgi:hypothetical protein
MSPCSYVNEAATSDIRSLLLIKRKTNGTAARKAALQQRAAVLVSSAGVNPALAGMNFSALGAAGAGQNPMAMLNGQALSNAMAILSENALRAGVAQLPLQQQSAQLNLLALQQQHERLQKQLQQHQQGNGQGFGSQQESQMNHNKSVAFSGLKSESDTLNQMSNPNNVPSLEQLHAQLAALSQQQQNNVFNQNSMNNNRNLASSMPVFLGNGINSQSMAPAPFGFSSVSNPASSALNQATAALNAQQQNSSMPATAAMDAASASAQTSNNLFESAANLKSLLNEHQQNEQAQNALNNNNARNQSSLFNRLPSSAGFLPENMSTLSFGNLLGSTNRLNSLLSLNSFLGSREASLADFAAAMPANMRDQLAAGANGVPQFHDASKFRSNP